MTIDKNFLSNIKKIQKDIDKILISYPFPDRPKYLYDPLKYVFNGKGKRLRPVLLILTGNAFGVEDRDLKNAALAVELLHNFTLVHDDIMDNDQMRHGQLTVQKKWDTSTSIFKRFNDVALDVCVGQA